MKLCTPPEAACTSLSRTQKLAWKVPEIQDSLSANYVWPSDSRSLWGFIVAAVAAAAEFADWLAHRQFGALSYISR